MTVWTVLFPWSVWAWFPFLHNAHAGFFVLWITECPQVPGLGELLGSLILRIKRSPRCIFLKSHIFIARTIYEHWRSVLIIINYFSYIKNTLVLISRWVGENWVLIRITWELFKLLRPRPYSKPAECESVRWGPGNPIFFFFINLFLAVLGLRCCVRAFSSCREQGLLFIAVRRLLIAVASLVAEHGL